MQVITSIEDCRGRFPASVCSVGNFDGLHLAHQDLLRSVRQAAAEAGAAALLVTFDPHPARVLKPDRAPTLLTTTYQKLELVERVGIDFVLLIPFDRDFAALEAEAFVRDILRQTLQVRKIFVGPNFSFGHDRRGDVAFLQRLAAGDGPEVTVIEPLEHAGEPVSSSRIRRDLRAGDIETVRAMLGRPYFIDGTVVSGQKMGKTLGIPTANLGVMNEMLPPDGVYVTELVRKGERFGSVTNIGHRPTFPGAGHAVETHIFEFGDQLYGETVRLHFLARLREERRFADVEELRTQIARDMEAALQVLERER
jgi:riboflavin kinase/FMN adenylyltransferase